MIKLTKLDNSPFLVSLEAIKLIDATPDSIIFFLNGDSMIVRESLEDIQNKVINLKAVIIEKSETAKQ